MSKIELKFWQIIFCMTDRAYMMVYGDGNFFLKFNAIVPEIPTPKHHKIHEFDQNYHFSAMKINKMFIFLIPAQPCSTMILTLFHLCDITSKLIL
jgi:hypothetical protein